MKSALDQSYAHCRRTARKRAKNFYYSFLLLSREKRNAMCAIYAFMRYSDDLSDEPGASKEKMTAWRSALDRALAGDTSGHPALPAFRDTVDRFRIPHQYFHDMIEGVASDLEPRRIGDFTQLYRYCYQVASVVGLSIIHIFGFEDARALVLAEKCGIAFQLTNILRDVREDAGLDRVYLPAEDLRRYGVEFEALRDGLRSTGFERLMAYEAERARTYYEESRPLLGLVHADSRPSLWALIEIYSRLLDRIVESDYDVLRGRIRLSAAEKSGIVLRAFADKVLGRS
jgi:15-cis-phytoene synthase